MSAPNRPVIDLRIGAVRAAIWANRSEGETYHTTSFSRLYKTEDGEWRDTVSFRPGDLLPLSKLADQAHTKILELQEEARAAGREEEPHADA